MADEPVQQQITLVDDNGEETLYDVLFTFKSEDFDRSYILIYPAGKSDNEEVEIQAYAFLRVMIRVIPKVASFRLSKLIRNGT